MCSNHTGVDLFVLFSHKLCSFFLGNPFRFDNHLFIPCVLLRLATSAISVSLLTTILELHTPSRRNSWDGCKVFNQPLYTRPLHHRTFNPHLPLQQQAAETDPAPPPPQPAQIQPPPSAPRPAATDTPPGTKTWHWVSKSPVPQKPSIDERTSLGRDDRGNLVHKLTVKVRGNGQRIGKRGGVGKGAAAASVESDGTR